MRGFQPAAARAKAQNYADGGMVQRLKQMAGLDHEYNIQQAAQRVREKQAQQQAQQQQQATQQPANNAISDYSGMGAAQRREKEAGFANGGMVRGPGSGTSDDVQDEVPEGTYIMPADSTQAVGADQLATMGTKDAAQDAPAGHGGQDGQGKQIPVQLSNGEYKLPPEQVHAIGVQALDQMKNATHQPVGFAPGAAQEAPEPRMFFANGGVVRGMKRLHLADAGVVTEDRLKNEGRVASPTNTFPGNRLPGDSGSTSAQTAPAAPVAAPTAPQLSAQAQSDRAKISAAWDTVKDVNDDAGRAIADVATMVPRGLAGAYDSAVVRPMRAAGIDAAYLSPKLVPNGVDPSSMTPFTDQKRMQQAQAAPAAAPVAAPTTTQNLAPVVAANPMATRISNGAQTAPTSAPTPSATAPGNQVMPGVYSHGRGQYSDQPGSMGFAPGFTGQPTAQAQTDAQTMAMAAPAAATNQGAQPRGFAPAVPGSGPVEPGSFTGGYSGVMGSPVGLMGSRTPEQQRRDAEVSASSITNDGGRWDQHRGKSPARQALEALDAQALEGVRGNNALARTNLEVQGSLQREGMQQAGATNRTQMQQEGETGRAGLMFKNAQGRLALDQQVRGLDIRAGQRMEAMQARYEAAKTPEERAAIAQQIRDLAGKPHESSWKVQVTPAMKNADGSTSEGSIYRYNTQTGQVERVDAGGIQAKPNGVPKIGETRNGYRYKGGNPNDQGNWEKA